MPRAVRRAAWGLAVTAAVAGVAGCGGDASGEQAYDTKVAVYLGVPLGGPWGGPGQAIARGAVLGLADSGGGVGSFSVRMSIRDVTDDNLTAVGEQGASREAGNALRDVGAVGIVGGLDPTSSRQLQLLGNQTGIGYVSASGDQIDASAADLAPQGHRMAVQLGAPDAAIAKALAERARAARCRRTVLVDVPGGGVGAAHDATDLRPTTTLRAATYADPQLAPALGGALRRGATCVVVTGEPSGGDPVTLLRPLAPQLRKATLLLSRGAASPGVARLVRTEQLAAEAIVDDPAPDATPETRRIDATYRKVYGTPAPVGVMAGWRGIKLMLRAIGEAGGGGNRRDSVSKALVRARVPGPPAEGVQRPDGTISTPAVSLATAQAFGWRVVRGLDGT